MQREKERHTQRLTATQSLAHSVRVRQCVRQNKRLEESVFACVCVLVRACACVLCERVRVRLGMCLSEEEEEENRVIIPFFV